MQKAYCHSISFTNGPPSIGGTQQGSEFADSGPSLL